MPTTLPAGLVGSALNDGFGHVDGTTSALQAEDARQQLLRLPDAARVGIFGVQAEKVLVDVSQARPAAPGLEVNPLPAQIGAHNAAV